MRLLPYGFDDTFGKGGLTKRYCCSCGEIFNLWDSEIDGCAWGPSFCHLYLITYGESFSSALAATKADTTKIKENHHKKNCECKTPLHRAKPSIFGFDIHREAAIVSYPLLNQFNYFDN